MKPTFRTTIDGLQVWVSGQVVIESTLHRVSGGYVACNPSLNHSAWNTTEQKEKCLKCFSILNNGQLKLFD